MLNTKLPIGVFDSGVGGLTVLRALQQRLPHESFLYLGDTARLPYGTKSQETVTRYAQQVSQILLDRGIKCLVIACNTATTFALPTLQASIRDIPVIGVIEPGAQAACKTSDNGHIIVLGTEATINSGSYQRLIQQIRPDAQVLAQACGLFVPLAEEGWVDGPIAEAIAQRYLSNVVKHNHGYKPDCLVLGCTHFPILLNAIQKVVGKKIKIIDSAHSTAEVVAQTLQAKQLMNPTSSAKTIHFLVTDSPERFARTAKYFLGKELAVADIELVDLSSAATTAQNSVIKDQDAALDS